MRRRVRGLIGGNRWYTGVGLVIGAALTSAWGAGQFPLPATTQPAGAGVAGSKHDFSRAEWSRGDLCSACHTPHRSEPPAAAPLWDSDADLTRRFGSVVTGDQSATRESMGESPRPRRDYEMGEGTRMCMRCHDGTLAKDTIGGVRPARFADSRHALFTAGHGATDHPVAVPYPDFDREYRPRSAIVAEGVVPIPHGNVECSSCHDPHNSSGEKDMLVTSNARSALCLTCHVK